MVTGRQQIVVFLKGVKNEMKRRNIFLVHPKRDPFFDRTIKLKLVGRPTRVENNDNETNDKTSSRIQNSFVPQ